MAHVIKGTLAVGRPKMVLWAKFFFREMAMCLKISSRSSDTRVACLN